MASGGVRFDFTTEDGFTHGENRTMRFVVKDANNVPVTDFTGWTFAWYLFTQLKDNRATIATDALVSRTSPTDITSSAPNVNVTIVPSNTLNRPSRTYWYELWRTDPDDNIRLAYGQWPLID